MNQIASEIKKYFLTPLSIWDHIPPAISDTFKANSKTISVRKNDMIYSEGTYSKGLYIVNKGVAKLYIIDNTGREQIIYMLTKNDMFGYRSILSNNNSLIYISAIEDCEIEMIDRDIFLSCLHQSFELNDFFLNYYGMEFRILIHKISVFSLKPVQERVALTLLILHEKFKCSNDGILPFNKKDIANFAGTIIETLSRQLKVLSNLGAIKISKREIVLLDKDLLFKLANI